MPTNVPQPTLGPAGYLAPPTAAVLAGVIADFQAAFGGLLNLNITVSESLTTPQGQFATSLTAIIDDCFSQFLWYVNNVDPAYAVGRMQDGIARIYFIKRNPALPTVVACTCVGLAGVIITLGATVLDVNGNTYACTQAGVIPIGGSIVLPFANQVTGPIACPAGAVTTIVASIPGWDTVSNADAGTLGENVESPSDFEARRQASVAGNSQGSAQAVLGAVLGVAGVLDAFVYENPTSVSVSYGGVTGIVANSLYVSVSGGAAAAIANAIWTKKGNGCNLNGNTSVVVYDTSYQPPQPSYIIQYQDADEDPAPIWFNVVIANSPGVPSNYAALIQAAILLSFAGADGGSRASIGATVYAARYYANVAALGAWAQIISIQVGLASTGPFGFSAPVTIAQAPVTSAAQISCSLM